MKRYLCWIVAVELLFAAGNVHAVEVEVPGLLTDHTVSLLAMIFTVPLVINGKVTTPVT